MANEQKAAGNLKILSIVWFRVLPPLFGGQKGVAFFNEYLGRLAPLHCLCAKSNDTVPASYHIENRLPSSKAQFFHPLCWRRILQAAKKQKASHVILEFPYHGIAGWLCSKILRTKMVVHSHNIEFLRFRQQGKWWWKLLYGYEKWTFRQADAVFVKTETDKGLAIQHFGIKDKRLTVIPFGINAMQKQEKSWAKEILRQRHGISPNEKLLLFAGTLDYGPNAEAVENICNQLLPRFDESRIPYRVVVCGRIVYKKFAYLNDLQQESLVFAGQVADIETYFSAADVFINPVSSGGGVQTKIADALSYHVNVVCFANMTEGIYGADGKLFTVTPGNWAMFADATQEALEKTEPTPAAFFRQHDWSSIADKAFRVIQNL
ncbi:glycosyltransferase family 4 protein [Flavisolibacter sp. BT320]|nr:glycosyltransferase family 4 protein [Flavisolibacter longurius]